MCIRDSYPKFTRRLNFFGYAQSKGQTFDNFLAVLKQKGEQAALSELKTEELYVFRLLTGCTDTKLREKLLDLKDPSLKDIIEEADKFENAKLNLKTLVGQSGQTSAAGAAAVFKDAKPKDKCKKCGRSVHKAGVPCPAKDKSCHTCKKEGHFSPMCPDKKKSGKNQGQSTRGRSVSFDRSKDRSQKDGESTSKDAHDRGRDWARRKHTPANSRSVSPAETVAAVFMVQHSTRPHRKGEYTLTRGGLTPRLAVEVSQENHSLFKFSALPDSGCSYSLVARDLVYLSLIHI